MEKVGTQKLNVALFRGRSNAVSKVASLLCSSIPMFLRQFAISKRQSLAEQSTVAGGFIFSSKLHGILRRIS